MRNQIEIAVIGAGNRGSKYLTLLAEMQDQVRISAIVDPDRLRAATASNILRSFSYPQPEIFTSCEDMLKTIKPEAAVIATPEREHFAQAMQLLDRGINILIEKPLAVTIDQCEQIAEKAHKTGAVAGVCHILRYHPYFETLIHLAHDASLGEVVSVTHRLDVGIDRATHTFVRGPWGMPELTSPMILSKGCHDMDIIAAITGSKVRDVYSVGGRHFFTHEKRPDHAADRCIYCPIETGCRFSAVDLYQRRKEWISGFIPYDGETVETVINRQLKNGEYGRCVFNCNNAAVDRQIVTASFDNGAVATVTMNLFTAEDNRDTHISLTGGEIHGNGKIIKVIPLRGSERIYDFTDAASQPYHAGADKAVLVDFISSITDPEHKMRTTINEVIESHRICMLASV